MTKKFVPFLVLAILGSACGIVSPQAVPTQTPYPTYTPYPTLTPYPTYTPFPTLAPTAACVLLAEVTPCVDLELEAQRQEDQALAERLRSSVVLIQAYTLEPVTGYLLEGEHGTGFIIRSDGYIVTSADILEGAAAVRVRFFDETELTRARIIAYLSSQDIGLVKVERSELTAVETGEPDSLVQGERLMAIGHPGILRWAVHVGSFVRSRPDDSYTVDLIVSDVPYGEGQRGAPVFNMAGELIGSVTAMTPEQDGPIPTPENPVIATDLCYSDGLMLSRAIPSDAIEQFVEGSAGG